MSAAERATTALGHLSVLIEHFLDSGEGFDDVVVMLAEAEAATAALPDGLPAKTRALELLAPARAGADALVARRALAARAPRGMA